MISRRLEHIAGDTFKDSEGRRVRGKLLTKEPILLSTHASSFWGRGFCRASCIQSWLDEHWKEYSRIHGDADGYVLSSNVALENNMLLYAVNFYKTEPVKWRR